MWQITLCFLAVAVWSTAAGALIAKRRFILFELPVVPLSILGVLVGILLGLFNARSLQIDAASAATRHYEPYAVRVITAVAGNEGCHVFATVGGDDALQIPCLRLLADHPEVGMRLVPLHGPGSEGYYEVLPARSLSMGGAAATN